MAIFDYSSEAELSPTAGEVGLFLTGRQRMRQPIGYGRFASAADAIRFAVEELPPELLLAAQLKVAEQRFDGDGIRRLYESVEYPLVRRAVSRERMSKSNDLSELRETPMKFRPLLDRVVVERIEAEDKTTGGIIIPDTAREKPSQGEIVAVGPGGRDEAGRVIPIDLKVGDRVLFGQWSGTEVKIDGTELLIMKESDIMGVVIEAVTKKKAA
jgi:chaperonin GroES